MGFIYYHCDLPPSRSTHNNLTQDDLMYFSVHCSATQSQDEHNSSRVATEEEDDASQPSSHLLKANETDSFHGLMDLLLLQGVASSSSSSSSTVESASQPGNHLARRGCISSTELLRDSNRNIIQFGYQRHALPQHYYPIRCCFFFSIFCRGTLLPRLGMGLYKIQRKNSITKDSHAAQLGSSTRPLWRGQSIIWLCYNIHLLGPRKLWEFIIIIRRDFLPKLSLIEPLVAPTQDNRIPLGGETRRTRRSHSNWIGSWRYFITMIIPVLVTFPTIDPLLVFADYWMDGIEECSGWRRN